MIMDSSPAPKDGPASGDAEPKPGGTLLRFKKLTTHLFGVGPKAPDTPPGKEDD